MKIKFNGEELDIQNGLTVNDLINLKKIEGMFVVEKNLEIVQKENYDLKLDNNDVIEIVGFFGGG